MEIIDIVHCEHVDKLLDVVDREEMTTAVEHESSIGKAWRVVNLGSRQCHIFSFAHHRQRLGDGLQSTEHGSMCGTVERDELLRDVDVVSLVATSYACYAQTYLVGSRAVGCSDADTGHSLDIRNKEFGVALLHSVACRIINCGVGVDDECRLGNDFYRLWQWYDIPVACLHILCRYSDAAQQEQQRKEFF